MANHPSTHNKAVPLGMKRIEVRVGTNKVRSEMTRTFDVDDDASDECIDEEAKKVMLTMIEWDWKALES